MHKTLEQTIKWLDRIFGGLACLALLGIIGVVLLQIIARYALPQAPAWTEEASRYLFAYTIVLASGSVIVRKRHVRLEMFQHRISRKANMIFSVVCHISIAVFAGFLLSHAWDYMIVGKIQTSPTLGIKMSWVFASAFIFFVLVTLFSVLAALQDIFAYRKAVGGTATDRSAALDGDQA